MVAPSKASAHCSTAAPRSSRARSTPATRWAAADAVEAPRIASACSRERAPRLVAQKVLDDAPLDVGRRVRHRVELLQRLAIAALAVREARRRLADGVGRARLTLLDAVPSSASSCSYVKAGVELVVAGMYDAPPSPAYSEPKDDADGAAA